MKNIINFLGIIALVVIIGSLFTACDEEKYGGNIVNKSGEAWVQGNNGYIFNSNGTFYSLHYENKWSIDESGTYKTSGETLTLTTQSASGGYYTQTYKYSVSGDTLEFFISYLYISMGQTYTRMTINISGFTIPENHNSMLNGQWINSSINNYYDELWFSFNVNSGTTYRVWWNDSYSGDGNKTMDIRVSAFISNDILPIFNGIDSGWQTPQSFTPSSSGTVYLRVNGDDYYDTGTFGIVYSTGSTRP